MQIDTLVQETCKQITTLFSPEFIYLFNAKRGINGTVTSFKLCIVLDFEDKEEYEKKIYLESNCPVPFDVILYTPEQWKKCLQDSMSFANTIVKTGVKIYG